MMGLNQYFKENILIQTEQYKWLYFLLNKRKIRVQKIANLGCGEGRETLTLACMLRANEALGIDRDAQSILNARNTLSHIQNIIWARQAPTDAPPFLQQACLEETIKFLSMDVTNPFTDIPSNHFDLVFCNFVLYHIWLDQGGENAIRKVIQEMRRITKVGGVIAACEPTRRTGKIEFEINFEPVFDVNLFESLLMESVPFENNQNTRFAYIKKRVA